MSSCTFTITSTGGVVYPNTPHSISYRDNRKITRFYFMSDETYAVDMAKNAESISMDGTETNLVTMQTLDTWTDNGYELTVSGFNDTLLDTVWIIENFTYTKESFYEYSWSLTLEKK